MAFSVCGQPTGATYVASASDVDRMMLVKTNIPLTEWHEKSFWSQYKNYLDKIQNVSMLARVTINELAETTKTTDEQVAYETGSKMIACLFNELTIRSQYFVEIDREHNGVIGLQFLQTEALLEMIERSRIYQQTSLQNFRFLPKVFSSSHQKQTKYLILTKALSLSSEEALVFFPIYSRYEIEVDETLGEDYSMYELFIGEASDLTPSLAKQQGNDLLTIMDREIKLKEKYFNEINTMVGSSLASRFLAWEDYYSIMCKMHAWLEVQ